MRAFARWAGPDKPVRELSTPVKEGLHSGAEHPLDMRRVPGSTPAISTARSPGI